MTKQYYYGVTGCQAPSADSPNCICWHDEGTGPRPYVRYDTNNSPPRWRDKPNLPVEAEAVEGLVKRLKVAREQVDDIVRGFTPWLDAADARRLLRPILDEAATTLTSLQSENARLTAQLEKCREALKPFAECCEAVEFAHPEYADNVAAYTGHRAPTVGELRRARAALSPTEERDT